MIIIFSIALGVSVLVAVNSLADAFMGAAQKPLQEVGADISIQRSGNTPDSFIGATLPCAQTIITSQEINNVKSIKGIKQVSTALLMWVFEGTDYKDGGDFEVVTGIDPEKKLGPSKANEWVVEGSQIKPNEKGVALIDSVYAGQKNIKVGDNIKITGYLLKVIGIVRTPPGSQIATSNIYIPLEDAQNIASQSKNIPGYNMGDINEIFIQADPGNLNGVIDEIKKAVPKADVTSAESFIKAIGGIAAQSRNLAILGSIIVLLFLLVIVAKTISGNILERRNEIGIMKTVGWTSKDIFRQMLSETLVQSVIGGITGIVIGFLAAIALGRLQVSIPVSWNISPFPHFLMTDTSQKAMTVGLPVKVSLGLIVLAFGMSLIVGVVSVFFTLRSINNIKPVEVLRYE